MATQTQQLRAKLTGRTVTQVRKVSLTVTVPDFDPVTETAASWRNEALRQFRDLLRDHEQARDRESTCTRCLTRTEAMRGVPK
jgi:hypothetical protein